MSGRFLSQRGSNAESVFLCYDAIVCRVVSTNYVNVTKCGFFGDGMW